MSFYCQNLRMFAFMLHRRGDQKQLADRPRAGSAGSKELRNRQLRNRHLSHKEMRELRTDSYILSSSRHVVIEEVQQEKSTAAIEPYRYRQKDPQIPHLELRSQHILHNALRV